MSAVARQRTRRERFARVRRSARLVADHVPITPLGALVAAGGVVLLRHFALGQDDLVAAVLGWVAIGVLALAFLLVVAASIALRVAIRRVPRGDELRFDTEGEVPTGFSLPNLAWLPLVTVDAEVEQDGLRSRTTAAGFRLQEHLTAQRRALHARVSRRIVVGDAFGLASVRLRSDESRSLVVEPHLGKLAELPTLLSLASGDALAHPSGGFEGDRVDVRRYAPGDPARHIHWPVLARTGKLVVRVQERAIAPTDRVVAYVVAGPDDEASAAAALAAVRHGALGPDWLLGADGTERGVRDAEGAALAIVRSAEHADEGGRDLETFVRSAEAEGPIGLVLFVPPTSGPWVERVLAVLAARPTGARVVVGIDALAPGTGGRDVLRFVRVRPPVPGVDRAALDALRTRLGDARALVTVVHRPSGRVLADGASVALELEAA